MPHKIVVIVVTWNSADHIRRCLSTLRAGACRDRVIVIDNASVDGTADIVRNEFPSATLVLNDSNRYLSHALNQGAGMNPGPDYLLVLNPDVDISAEAISRLAEYLDTHPKTGIVAPRLEYPDGTLQYSCRKFPTLASFVLRGLGFNTHPAVRRYLMTEDGHTKTRQVDWVLFACMLVRKNAFESAGGVNEKYPLYYNDVDLCHRMHRLGWEVVYVPKARAIHRYERASARGGLGNALKWRHIGSGLRFILLKTIGL